MLSSIAANPPRRDSCRGIQMASYCVPVLGNQFPLRLRSFSPVPLDPRIICQQTRHPVEDLWIFFKARRRSALTT